MRWDPATYLRWGDHRRRPGLDLIGRIPSFDPVSIVDLGCGTGDLTDVLARRFPGATVVGVDSSSRMLERATSSGHSDRITWSRAEITAWAPDTPADLVFSNAALHWVDDHPTLFRRLADALTDRGVLAVQMPDNWAEPTHRVPARILDTGAWPAGARAALMRDRVATPRSYRAWLGDTFDVDLWTTTYHHVLTGADPVLSWVEGSLLAPVVGALAESDRDAFRRACSAGYRAAYPPEQDGSTVLPFRRLFIVARRR